MNKVRKLVFSEWKTLTSNNWILDTIKWGYKIEFDEIPVQTFVPKEISFNCEKAGLIDAEIEKLLNKGAIQKCDIELDQFISNVFVVPKKDGSLRPVLNLTKLNGFIHYEHFKQENINFALDLIQKDDFLTSIDLTDAYFSVRIHKDFRKFLRFTWRGVLYEFKCLCFGISSAPRIFTKILKPVYAFFRQLGIRCIYYIDDSLIMNQDYCDCLRETNIIESKLVALGYGINFKKSSLIPTKTLVFFGLIIDTACFKIFLTEEKIERIDTLGNIILQKREITVRTFASFIGLIVHAFNAVTVAKLHYRNLEKQKVDVLKLSNDDYDFKFRLSQLSIQDIEWWISNIRRVNGKPIRPNPVDCWLECDASLEGWGSNFNGQTTGGRWSLEESSRHINYLELLAVFLSIKSFFDKKQNIHVGIKSDNVTTVYYINEMGGMTSESLNNLAIDIWSWCLERNIFLSAQHIPGTDNVAADYMSRNFSDSKEWMLKKDIFQRICKQFFNPDTDLFASRLNYQVPVFASWLFDPLASFTDAFTISWSAMRPYIFPPFSLIGKIIDKILLDKVEKAIIIVPFWPTQSWFPLLISVLVSLPARLPRHTDLLKMPHTGELHPMKKHLNLVACVISGNICTVKDFRRTLLKPSSHRGEQEQLNNMNFTGKSGLFGVIEGTVIPFIPLNQKC